MKVQPAAFLRTTLPLGLDAIEGYDTGRYHSIWLPDHMVSFWPDALWNEEFTDLATVSPSPHRHIEALSVAGATAVLSKRAKIATSVIDTVRRHPSLLAQTALTLDHLSKGRFILGIGSGEAENTVPYGFDFSKPVGRFEEAIKIIKLLWHSEGPVDFEGQFFKLHHARLETEFYDERPPQIWTAAGGPRMLKICGREADGWWPAGAWMPEQYAEKLAVIRQAAEEAGRDPQAITPAFIQTCLIADDDAELAEIVAAPLVKSILLQLPAAELRKFGHEHPMGESWGGFVDLDPTTFTRKRIIAFCNAVTPEMVLDLVPHGTPKQVASRVKAFCEAGLRVPKILDYGGMAGLKYGAKSPAKVRATEDELFRLLEQEIVE